MTGILERVFAKRKTAEQAVATSWNELIQRVVDESINESEVDATLQALGKTLQELQAATELRQNRQSWLSMADELPALQRASDDIGEAMLRADNLFNEKLISIRQGHIDAKAELTSQMVVIQQQMRLAGDALAKLSDTQPVEIRRRASAVLAEITKRQDEVSRLHDQDAERRDNGRSLFISGDESSQIQRLKQQIATLQAKLTDIESGGV